MQELDLPDAAATEALGRALARHVHMGSLLLLRGPLGAGKTTLVRALVAELGGDPAQVASPTFTLMNVYEGRLCVYHVDAYRLHGGKDLRGIGFFELSEDGLGIIEWPERVQDAIAEDLAITVDLRHHAGARQATVRLLDEAAPPIVLEHG